MTEFHEQLGRDVHLALAKRLGVASVLNLLSDRDSKLLSIMQEPDGRKFVMRAFEHGAERQFGGSFFTPDLSFEEGLSAMINMYQSVGLDVVKSSLLPAAKDTQVTVISEYMPNLISVDDATLQAKKKAVNGLGRLLDPSIPYLPAPDALVCDLFMYHTDEYGEEQPIIVDIDPRLGLKELEFDFGNRFSDTMRASYIERVGIMIEHWWANNDEEMAQLARGFFAGLSTIADDSIHEGHKTLEAITNVHALTQPELMSIRRR
jgi:hypothetical protein